MSTVGDLVDHASAKGVNQRLEEYREAVGKGRMIHSFDFDFIEMAASLAVPINPELLVWARETTG